MRWAAKHVLMRTAGIGLLGVTLSACAQFSHQKVAKDEAPVVIGPSVRDNRTPLDAAFHCYGSALSSRLQHPLSIGVGEVRDYTGSYSDFEGNTITQGASPMIFSALFKLGDVVRVHERFDTRVAELELAYMEKRRLGSGRNHKVDGSIVPWKPYYGGSILQSGYYIVGGITELNYNIQSGGAEVRVGQTGPKARTYTMSIAADLRLVNTQSLVVESAVSVQKQITGYEIGFELFRFFGSGSSTDLVDINIGSKSQEPLQLGVRSVLELGTIKLLSDLTGVDHTDCLPKFWHMPSDEELKAAAREYGGQDQEGAEAKKVGYNAGGARAPAGPNADASTSPSDTAETGGSGEPETPAAKPGPAFQNSPVGRSRVMSHGEV